VKAALLFACWSLVSALAPVAHAHNVWCHGACGNPKHTVEFYQRAGDVYMALSRVKNAWQEANNHLEHGVIAEFESKLDPSSPVHAYEFRYALQGYMRMRGVLVEFDEAIARLQAVDKKCDKVQKYEAALARLLADGRPIPRLSQAGVRYADAAGLSQEQAPKLDGTTAILAAWRTDVAILTKTLDEVLAGLRDAIPLAEKGEFAQVMLSGRNAFGDKMPQFTDMFSAFDRLYVMTVMATIQTTMEVYPTGYDWLIRK
jgi:hypothetical protein